MKDQYDGIKVGDIVVAQNTYYIRNGTFSHAGKKFKVAETKEGYIYDAHGHSYTSGTDVKLMARAKCKYLKKPTKILTGDLNELEIIDAGYGNDTARVAGDKVYFYNYKSFSKPYYTHIFTVHIDDIKEVFRLVSDMRKANETYLEGLANTYITHMWLPKYRGQSEALIFNTLYMYYVGQCNAMFIGDRYSKKDIVENPYGTSLAFHVGNVVNIICGIDEYKDSHFGKVKCVLDGQEIWLSKGSIQALKDFGNSK